MFPMTTEQRVYPQPATAAELPPLEDRYRSVMQRVADTARKAGRRPQDVAVVAVTKTAGIDDIRRLIELGHRDFGENRVQQLEHRAAMIAEAIERRARMPSLAQSGGKSGSESGGGNPLKPEDIRWHMIGWLQRNKIKKAISVARIIHSVADLRLAEDLHMAAMKRDVDVDVLVQVNCSGEGQKNGCPLPAARHLCESIDSMSHLRVRGLMTMAALDANPDTARFAFERCQEAFEDIRKTDIGDGRFNILSMGMTNDFETAIECGANLVRIGSAIFGPPTHTDELHDDEDDAGD